MIVAADSTLVWIPRFFFTCNAMQLRFWSMTTNLLERFVTVSINGQTWPSRTSELMSLRGQYRPLYSIYRTLLFCTFQITIWMDLSQLTLEIRHSYEICFWAGTNCLELYPRFNLDNSWNWLSFFWKRICWLERCRHPSVNWRLTVSACWKIFGRIVAQMLILWLNANSIRVVQDAFLSRNVN